VNHAFGGWHHVSGRKPVGRTSVSFTVGGDFSTYDCNNATKLILACHAVRVRAEISGGGPRRLKVTLSPRMDRLDDWSEHHPSLDDLIQQARDLQGRLAALEPAPRTEDEDAAVVDPDGRVNET
jgi:hypothetical protein